MISAGSMHTGRRGAIGIIVPDITNPYLVSIVKGLKQALPDCDYRIFLTSKSECASPEATIVADLASRVDGNIPVPTAGATFPLKGKSASRIFRRFEEAKLGRLVRSRMTGRHVEMIRGAKRFRRLTHRR